MNKNGFVKSHENFVLEINDLFHNEYSVIGEYKNNKTKILIKHHCGFEWEITPNNLLRGHGCPKCSKVFKKKTIDFKEDVYKKYKDEYCVVGEYVNSHVKIQIKHNICGHTWEVKPYSFLNGRKCPKCARINVANSKRKTQKQFETEVINLTNDEYLVVSEYINALTKIKMKHNCVRCNYHEWEVKPSDFLNNNSRCPVCQESKGEKEITNFLINNKINFIPQKKFEKLLGSGNGKLSYDFYLPDYNLLIEYQGNYHDGTANNQTPKDFLKQKEHDKRKKQYAIDNNIKLLEIWYYDFNNIEEILNKELK